MARIMGHLRACSHCRNVFQDSVLFRGLWETGAGDFNPTEETVSLGKSVAAAWSADHAAQRASDALVPLFIRRNLRYVAIAACAAFIVISWMAIGSHNRRESSLAPAILAPVKRTVENATRIGPFVFPETEHALSMMGPVYRNGSGAFDDSLSLSMRHLLKLYRDEKASSDNAYWLLAGYIATGRIDMARALASDLEHKYPRDNRILELRAIIEYLDGNIERSADMLRSVHERVPDDPATGINLAVALCKLGSNVEAERIFDRIMKHAAGAQFEERVKSIHELCEKR